MMILPITSRGLITIGGNFAFRHITTRRVSACTQALDVHAGEFNMHVNGT